MKDLRTLHLCDILTSFSSVTAKEVSKQFSIQKYLKIFNFKNEYFINNWCKKKFAHYLNLTINNILYDKKGRNVNLKSQKKNHILERRD